MKLKIFSDPLKELKKASEPLYRTPKSVQQTIEMKAVSENGIFEVANGKFTKSYRFGDLNYITNNESGQLEIMTQYGKLLNALEYPYKITVNGKNKNMELLRKIVFLEYQGDENDRLCKIYNDIIEKKILEGKQGIEKEMYLTLTVERKNFEEAKLQFATMEATIKKSYQTLGAEIVPLTGNERLQILYDYYHLGCEGGTSFDLRKYKENGQDFRNDLCNSSVQYFPDYYKDDNKYGRALFFKRYPNHLSDDFLNQLTSLPYHFLVSIDVVPVPKDITTSVLQKKYMGIESDILRQQRVRNKNQDFSTEISYAKRVEKKEIEEIMDDVRENDQCLFYVAVTLVLMGESKNELEQMTKTVQSIGREHGVMIEKHYYRQREALNTALPIGVRQVETMRALLTQSLATLMPFHVQELNHKGGIYYGINQISKNINVGNRKILMNGNGFVFGVPGSGKSFFCKQEMGFVYLKRTDDIIVIDPMHEYFDVANTYGGSIINMSTYTDNYVNPLAMDLENLDMKQAHLLISDKCEFMLGVCEQCMGEITPQQRSIIDKCLRELYVDVIRGKEKKAPVMSDFYNKLLEKNLEEANDIALALEIFVHGSLNIFNHQTNIDTQSRITVYGIQDLGTQLRPLSMLVMMEAIQQKIIENGKKGKATWLYIDEMHVLLNSEYSASYLQQLWKKVRKQGGLCTGITQNIADLLQSEIATTMLSNSEFVVLLKQANPDSERLEQVIGVSDSQLKFVDGAIPGTGLIKCGNVTVPFDNQIEKDTDIYQLYNTNIHEMMNK